MKCYEKESNFNGISQRALCGEKKQRKLKRKWPWSSAPRCLFRLQRVHP